MTSDILTAALAVAASGAPVLPLAGKFPVGNCPACKKNACGGRPHMKDPGPCRCPAPCHGWAAATTEQAVITSRAWAAAWRRATTLAYHPAGADLTVVDLDNADAVAWAQRALPPTRTVQTTRGEHWIYRGTTPSATAVLPGVDIKSRMAYARWLGPGTGTLVDLPPAILALPAAEETTPPTRGSGLVSSWDRTVATGCRHTESYVRTGLDRGLAMVLTRTQSGAGSKSFGVAQFLAGQHAHCPGPCGLDTIGAEIIHAAVSVGVPEPYARRAVTRGLATRERST